MNDSRNLSVFTAFLISNILGKGADCSLKDSSLNTPLHYFCMLTYKLKDEHAEEEEVSAQENEQRLSKEEYCRCLQYLLDAGADLKEKNDNGIYFLRQYV